MAKLGVIWNSEHRTVTRWLSFATRDCLSVRARAEGGAGAAGSWWQGAADPRWVMHSSTHAGGYVYTVVNGMWINGMWVIHGCKLMMANSWWVSIACITIMGGNPS